MRILCLPKVQKTLIFLKCFRDAEKIAKTVCVFAGNVTVYSIWDTVGCKSQ